MLNYTNELALPNISNFTKHREEEVHGGGSGWKGESFVMRSYHGEGRRGGEERNIKIYKKKKKKEQQGETNVLKTCDFLTVGCCPAGTVLGMLGSVVMGSEGG